MPNFFHVCFMPYVCDLYFFLLLSSFKLVESFNLTKNSCVYALYVSNVHANVHLYFFFKVSYLLKDFKVLYFICCTPPPLRLPPTTFNVIEIFTEWSNYCVVFIPSLRFVKTFVKFLICYITFIALFQVCQQFSKCLVCYLFTSPISL
jgi:hypothetical protein